MALTRPTFCRLLQSLKLSKHINTTRASNTLTADVLDKHRAKQNLLPKRSPADRRISVPEDLKYAFPEFVPHSVRHFRDSLVEQLERNDMYLRRKVIKLPEFYVGSILAVTVADEYAPGKKNRFVGLCIDRGGNGLRAWFTLRNVIDNQGVEITYEMYNPLIANIELLKMEKRLDSHLRYLRDAPLDHSRIPFDMIAIPLPEGSDIPVYTQKIKLNPKPWHERWERQELHGAELVPFKMNKKKLRKHNMAKEKSLRDKYDLMKHYRDSPNSEMIHTAMSDLIRNRNR